MGSLEALVFVVVTWCVVVVVLYWVIRLAVRHGIQDARRLTRADRAATGVGETIRRQQATYGGSEPQ